MRSYRLLLTSLWLGAACAACLADTLVTTDGRSFEGRLIRRDDRAKKLEFEVIQYGAKMTMIFDLDKVASIKQGALPATSKPVTTASAPAKLGEVPPEPAPPPLVKIDGPSYYVIPMRGMVGKLMVAQTLEKSLADAVGRKPSAVVLEMDSPGGYIMEVEKLIAAIREYNKQLRIVVYVKQEAISAAAITTLAAKEIYVNPAGLIGAATAFQVNARGIPENIEAKFESVWRALSRSSAETGGHSSLLAEAMIDGRINLHVVEEGGKKVIKEGTGARMITRLGKPITLTANEAVECGLANAKVDGYAELGKAMGFADWKECAGLGRPLADHWEKAVTKMEADMKKLRELFEDNMHQAVENDPTQFSYTVWSHNQKFTPESKAKWESRSAACARFLLKAEENCRDAGAVAEKCPQLLEDPEEIRKSQKRVAEIRTRIARGIYKSSPVNE